MPSGGKEKTPLKASACGTVPATGKRSSVAAWHSSKCSGVKSRHDGIRGALSKGSRSSAFTGSGT